jgi:hypothetical protein
MIVDFGKYQGQRWTRIPLSYLRWLVNERTQYSEIAKAELDRRGSSVMIDKSVELSAHAIDKASLRLRKIWHETAIDDNEGIYTWLERISGEAYKCIQEGETDVIYSRIKFAFMVGEVYPVLKTVMPAPRIHYKQKTNSGIQIVEITYRHVYIELLHDEEWISIHVIKTTNMNELRQVIDIIRGDFPNKQLMSSAPVNDEIKQVFIDKNILQRS